MGLNILRIGLRAKLIIASLLVLTPILILLIQNYRAAYETRRDEILADQVRAAQTVSIVIDDSFDEALAIANSYAADPVILRFDSQRINNYLVWISHFGPQR